jgi:hypothetical protein
MRIAHIIITHKNPAQLERLLHKMQYPDFDFYIHVDKKVEIGNFEYLKRIKGVKFIENRIICNWGGYSTLQAMLNSLKEVLENDVSYDFYNLLSAQDYPLKSNDEIYSFFLENREKSFLFFETASDSKWWEGAVDRFQKYHLTDYDFPGKFFLEAMINKVLPKRRFPMKMELYGGSKSSWWTLNNETASYLVDFFKLDRHLDKFLKYCWGTDEFIIPTVLLNSPLKANIVNDNLRYIDFLEGKANPKILGPDDLTEMVNSNMLFARKFDIEINTDILDQLDRLTH